MEQLPYNISIYILGIFVHVPSQETLHSVYVWSDARQDQEQPQLHIWMSCLVHGGE